MNDRRASSPALAGLGLLVALFVPTLGCKKLLQGLKDGADDAGATPSASASASAAPTTATADTTPAPTTSPADEAFSAPGACIDVAADLLKRTSSRAPQIVDKPDLDGDGKPDKVIRLDLGEVPGPTVVYVMRGSCGHFVGQFTSNSVKLTGNKSRGLKSLEVFEQNLDCTDPCKCNDKSTAFFFNGKAYQAAKAKDVPRKCADGGAPSASAATSGSGARGSLCTVAADCTAPFKCVLTTAHKGKASCEKPCTKSPECDDTEICRAPGFNSPVKGNFCTPLTCGGDGTGEVAVDIDGERECAKPCKTDAECTQSFRPRQCQPGGTQVKPRKAVSTCFPR